MALHITQILCGIVLEFLLFVFCFCIFFAKASLVMTCCLHQWDPISYLSLESFKLISQVSITCYFPTVITFLLAKTLYPGLIYAYLGPRLCGSSLPHTKVHCHYVFMAPSCFQGDYCLVDNWTVSGHLIPLLNCQLVLNCINR